VHVKFEAEIALLASVPTAMGEQMKTFDAWMQQVAAIAQRRWECSREHALDVARQSREAWEDGESPLDVVLTEESYSQDVLS
jgi:hypothetical protein